MKHVFLLTILASHTTAYRAAPTDLDQSAAGAFSSDPHIPRHPSDVTGLQQQPIGRRDTDDVIQAVPVGDCEPEVGQAGSGQRR